MKCVSRSYWWLSRIFATALSLTITPEARGVSSDVYGNPARWQDESGQTFKLESLRGKKTVFALFYSSCKTICPMTVKSLQAIESGLAESAKDVQFILVTIDPADNKAPEQIKNFVKNQKISSQWKVLSSDAANTRSLAGALGIGFEEKPVNGNFHNMHSLSVVVVRGDGSISGQLPVATADAELVGQLLKK